MEMEYRKTEDFACWQIQAVEVSKQVAPRLHMPEFGACRELQFCSVVLDKASLVSFKRGLDILYTAAFISI